MIKGKNIVKSYESLKKDRSQWETHWEEIARFIYPNQDDDFLGSDTNKLGGEKRTRNIVDPTGPQAMQTLAAGLHGLMTNPASKWFKLTIDDSSKEMESWLRSVEDKMFKELSNSNSAFSSHIHEMYLDFCAFSTACIFIGENRDLNDIIYKAVPLSQIYIAENSDGVIDTAYREINFTASQMKEKFGDKISDKVKKALEKNRMTEKFLVIHCVKPDKENKMFDSVYVEYQEKNILKEGTYSSFPYGIPRFTKSSNEIYGRGPSMLALPEVKMLNRMKSVLLKITEKIGDPPIALMDDSIIGKLSLVPGGVNYFNKDYAGGKFVEKIDIAGSPSVTFEMIQESKASIRSIYYLDQIQFTGEHKMTATEVMQRTEERMRMLGPLLGRMQKECLDIIISRTFELLVKQKRVPVFPLGETIKEYNIEYISPIAKAQKQTDAANFERAMSLASPLFSIDPKLVNKVNGEVIIEDVFDLFGLNPEWFRSKEEYAKATKALEDQQKLQEAVAIGKDASSIGSNISKSIGE